MTETWVSIFGTNALAIEAGAVSVRPGLGRHQLCVALAVRPTDPAAYDQMISVGGRVEATNLSGRGGYLGTAHRSQSLRLFANGKLNLDLLVDLEPGQIEAIEMRRNGGFGLRMQLEVRAGRADSGTEVGATSMLDHQVSRETWLQILEQTDYRKTMVLELGVPDSSVVPALSEALRYFADAQRWQLEGENRLTVESLRQSLAALVGKPVDEEDDAEDLTGSLKTARSLTRAGAVAYQSRFELTRQALKFLTDLGAHPEVAETRPAEARSTLAMVAGLLQWYTT